MDALEAKRREADAARERMLGLAHTVQGRLKVDVLAEQALERVREKGEQAANGALEAARRRPVAAAAAAAGLVGLISIGPISRLVRRFRNKDEADA